MGLNANQKRAVEYLDGPLLVLAGPGTGKTQLLSEKVMYILKNTDADASNILCLTFTDTGAKNMRERLKSMIGKDAMKVTIGTYHAFGQEILTEYKNYAPDYDRRLDAPIDEVHQYKIIKEIQDNLTKGNILRGDAVKDIISVISEAKSADLNAEDLKTIAEVNTRDSNSISCAVSDLLKQAVPRKLEESLNNAYRPILEVLSYPDYEEPLPKGVQRTVVGLVKSLKEAINEALDAGSVSPLTKWRNNYFEIGWDGNYRLKDYAANKKLHSIALMMREYEDHLQARGLFDFDDMIEEAVKALRNDAGFRATLQERYQYIMLDEFQDTNPSQFAIVKALTDYEKPVIMAVGDDDQAIYEFQGALSSNFMDFQKTYNAEVIPLVENYRSTQEILDFATHVIEQAPDRFVPEKALIAHKEEPRESQIHRFEFNSSDMEYAFIADKIDELISTGVKQNEIAVISAKRKYFEPLLPYLKSHDNIKIAYEKRDDLFNDNRIHQVLTMLKYAFELANNQKPTVQLMEILSYDFWQIKMLEVVKLVNAARAEHETAFNYLAEHGGDEIREAMEFLGELAGKAYNVPINTLLFDVAMKMDTALTDEYARFCFYENLAALIGKLKKHVGNDKPLKLKDLIEMVDDYEAAEMSLSTTSPYRDAEEAVQILTAHKSKGLEFEYVFIISADHTAWGKGKGNNNFLSLPKNLTYIRHTGVTESERLRVLYVALTRAKSTLFITNSLYDFNGKAPDRLEYFDERVEKDETGREVVVSPFLPTREVVQIMTEPDVRLRKDNIRNWITTSIIESPDMRAFYHNAMRDFKMSGSALTTFIDIIYGGPVAFFEQYVVHVMHEGDSLKLVLGNLMHKTFEQVTKQGLTTQEAVQYFKDELKNYDTTDEIKEELKTVGPENVEAVLKEFGKIIRAGEAEVNLGSERIVVNGVPVTGRIDHIVVDDKNKTIEVYDYKTGAYHDEAWRSHPALYCYMLQLEFYKMLLNNSRKYGKYKVTKGHILFVTEDSEGNLHDKEYIYNATDEEEFMKLVAAVYKEATTLKFIDDEELYIEPNKNRNMKAMRDFIALVLAKNSDV